MVPESSHQSAIDQARLLVAYLDRTPSPDWDMRFIGHHLDALSEFAWAACGQGQPGGGRITAIPALVNAAGGGR